jgi:hypothetical protein
MSRTKRSLVFLLIALFVSGGLLISGYLLNKQEDASHKIYVPAEQPPKKQASPAIQNKGLTRDEIVLFFNELLEEISSLDKQTSETRVDEIYNRYYSEQAIISSEIGDVSFPTKQVTFEGFSFSRDEFVYDFKMQRRNFSDLDTHNKELKTIEIDENGKNALVTYSFITKLKADPEKFQMLATNGEIRYSGTCKLSLSKINKKILITNESCLTDISSETEQQEE